jgi:4-amino-4-deoxy-L-arabinose transferase-like glycosyltransferase
VLFKLAGGEREWLARLVPALLGALATPLVVGLARRLIGRRAAWVAALVWLSSYFVFDEYRKAMADPYLAFFTLLCAWAWVRGGERRDRHAGRMDEQGRPSPSSVFRPFSTILVVYSSLAFGFLAKGPLILPPVAGFILAYHVCFRRPVPRGVASHLLGLLMFAAIALPWPAAVWRAVPDAGRLWVYESGGGVTDTIENERAWWFYVANLPLVAVPWTPALIVAIALPVLRQARRAKPSSTTHGFPIDADQTPAGASSDPTSHVRTNRTRGTVRPRRSRARHVFPIVWLMLVVIAFSLSSQKKNAYLLPVAPATALTVTQAILAVLARARLGRLKGWPGALLSVQLGLGLVGGALLVAAAVKSRSTLHPWSWTPWAAIAMAAAFVPLLFPRCARRQIATVAAGYAVAVFVLINFFVTDQENARSPRRFAQAAGRIVGVPGANVFTPRLPPEAGYYLPLGLCYDPSAPEVFVIVDDRRRASEGGVAYFEARVGRPVAGVERVVDAVPDDPRWRLYRVRLAPMIAGNVP